MIDQFTKDRFEEALPDVPRDEPVFVKGEWVYTIPVFRLKNGERILTNKRLVVRSSLDRSGVAAASGVDSIRHWVEYEYKGRWYPLAKAGKAYTTRVAGWEQRLTDALRELWRIALDDDKKAPAKPAIAKPTTPAVDSNETAALLYPPKPTSLLDLKQKESAPATLDPFAFLGDEEQPQAQPIQQEIPVSFAPALTLNPYQQKVVEALEGPQVVEAVPGSGKTRTLEYRVAHLLASGADPAHIGVFTFSNSAASEARYRIARTLWPDSTPDELAFFADPFKNKDMFGEDWIDSDPRRQMLVNWVCTIHAMSLRLLKEMGEKINVLSDRHQWEANALIKDSLAEMRWKEAVDSVKAYISMAILNLVEPARAEAFYSNLLAGTDVAWRARDLAEIYRRYHDFCRVRKLVDFDMMQAMVVKKLRYDPVWRKRAQQKFDYILVDEAQDADYIQAEILWTLAENSQNVVFVGDVDQSMYAFRGARPSVLREDFASRWPTVRRFSLPVNYRSTHSIVRAAAQLISFNYDGPEDIYLKNFQALETAPEGMPLTYTEVDTFDALCKEIAVMVIENPSAYFVLSRTRAECAAIHTELVRQGIPAINKSGGMLFGAPHVRKVLAYAMLACDYNGARDNLEILSEIANVASIDFRAPFTKRNHLPGCTNNRGWVDCGCPTVMIEGQDCVTARYYGEKAIQEAGSWRGIQAQCYEKNRGGFLTPRAKGAQDLVQFVERLEALRDDARACLNLIISDSIQPWLEAEHGDAADLAENGNMEDLTLLVNMAKPGQTLEQYLEEINRLSQGGKGCSENESVILGTAHWAKGAEREKVICNITRLPIMPPKQRPGCLPMGCPPTIEEERRLLYVMITRAKSECYIVAAREWNGQDVGPSEFIAELGLQG